MLLKAMQVDQIDQTLSQLSCDRPSVLEQVRLVHLGLVYHPWSETFACEIYLYLTENLLASFCHIEEMSVQVFLSFYRACPVVFQASLPSGLSAYQRSLV